MTDFKRKTIFGNWYSQKKLEEFLLLLKKYFKIVEGTDVRIKENEEVRNLRSDINQLIPNVSQIMLEANISTNVEYSGKRGQITVNILHNVFHLDKYEDLTSQWVIDFVERAIGTYIQDKYASIFRMFNPIFWVTKFTDWIFNIPLYLLKRSGFNATVKDNVIFKLIKFIFNLSVFLASILTILHLLGYLETGLKYFNYL